MTDKDRERIINEAKRALIVKEIQDRLDAKDAMLKYPQIFPEGRGPVQPMDHNFPPMQQQQQSPWDLIDKNKNKINNERG